MVGNVKPPDTPQSRPDLLETCMQSRGPRIMTKEFLPGLKGTQRLTHDMSITHRSKLRDRAAEPKCQDCPYKRGSCH